MSFDLSGVNGSFRFVGRDWEAMLALALWGEWHPEGTVAGDRVFMHKCVWQLPQEEQEMAEEKIRKEWDGADYFSNSGQWVNQSDASGLADALEKVLPRISGDDSLDRWRPRIFDWMATMTEQGTLLLQKPPVVGNPMKHFSGSMGLKYIGEFIAFCRQCGGFEIH